MQMWFINIDINKFVHYLISPYSIPYHNHTIIKFRVFLVTYDLYYTCKTLGLL
jgi:hypothetical protein